MPSPRPLTWIHGPRDGQPGGTRGRRSSRQRCRHRGRLPHRKPIGSIVVTGYLAGALDVSPPVLARLLGGARLGRPDAARRLPAGAAVSRRTSLGVRRAASTTAHATAPAHRSSANSRARPGDGLTSPLSIRRIKPRASSPRGDPMPVKRQLHQHRLQLAPTRLVMPARPPAAAARPHIRAPRHHPVMQHMRHINAVAGPLLRRQLPIRQHHPAVNITLKPGTGQHRRRIGKDPVGTLAIIGNQCVPRTQPRSEVARHVGRHRLPRLSRTRFATNTRRSIAIKSTRCRRAHIRGSQPI